MSGKISIQVLIVTLMSLAGCAQPVVEQKALVAKLAFGQEQCEFEMEGHRFVVGHGEGELAAFLKTPKNKNREVHIIGSDDTPYRCVGGVMASLQSAGVPQIGFLAEPPEK